MQTRELSAQRTGAFEGGMRYVALLILALLIVFLLATIGRDLLFSIPGSIDSVIQGFMGELT